MKDSQKRRKSRMKKKEEEWRNRKKGKTLGKTSTMIYFPRIKWCRKKQEIQNLIAKQV